MQNLWIVLLSGGSGERLWPLSNGVRAKQFLKLLKAPDGQYESMCQRVVRQLRAAGISENLTVATSALQRDSIISQIGENINIVDEPERRDTFPAIALASSFLLDRGGAKSEDSVIVMPIDPYTESGYFESLLQMSELVQNKVANIVLMGIIPSEPSSKFGYIVPEAGQNAGCGGSVHVGHFCEKPDSEKAKQLIEEGALWNAGVFAFKLKYMLDVVQKYLGNVSFEYVRAHYRELPKNSFDYEILEREMSISAVAFDGEWKDLGTWNSLSEEIGEASIGRVVLENSQNTNVINELDVPVVCAGLKDTVVAASPDGIFVGNKSESVNLKEYVRKIKLRPMFEERRWGEYKVLSFETFSDGHKVLTKQLTFKDGGQIDAHLHRNREEIWTVVNGTGRVVLDGEEHLVKTGDSVKIPEGKMHSIKAIRELKVIEIQTGQSTDSEDIERFPKQVVRTRWWR